MIVRLYIQLLYDYVIIIVVELMCSNRVMKKVFAGLLLFTLGLASGMVENVAAQKQDRNVRTVSIPISIYSKSELREGQTEELLHVDRLIVKEKGEEAQILSIRSVTDAPLSLAIVIQDDLVTEFNLQLRDIAAFIRGLPPGSRVMVAYLRSGSFQVRQRFTDNLEQAARSLRIVTSSESSAPRNPYDGLIDVLNRFDALPAGRRAIIMFSDGLDISGGISSASPGQSTDLSRAIDRAQRKSVAVFPIYIPTVLTGSRLSSDSLLILHGQGSLQKLADETGGRAFHQGSFAPVSLDPYIRQLKLLLNRQFLLSYLSNNMKRGYYRVQVLSTNPDVKIEHPHGYYYQR